MGIKHLKLNIFSSPVLFQISLQNWGGGGGGVLKVRKF